MKKITTLILSSAICLFSAKSFAQFTQMWMAQYQHTVTNGYSSESRKVVEDAAGNIYMLSDATSNLDSTGVIAGGTHHYAVLNKYSAGGGRLHRKAIEVFSHVVSGWDNLGSFGLEIDANANVYVGYSPYASASNFNVAIAKYDSTLTRIWVSQYGTNASDVGVDMKLAASGMVYFVEKTVNGGTTTYSVLKTNSGNAPTSIYTFTANTDVINSLALGSNEDMYLTGYRIVSGAKTVLMAGIDHLFYNPKWINIYNGNFAGDDVGNMITVGADGNIYAVGTSTQNATRGTDVVILKHSPAPGTKMTWTSLQNYTTADIGNIITVPEVDYAYVGGTSGNQVILYRLNITSVPIAQTPTYYRPSPTNLHTSINGLSLSAMKVSASKKVYITGGINSTDMSGQAFSALYLAKFSIVFGNALSLTYAAPTRGDYSNNLKGTGLSLDYGKSDIYWLCDNWNNNSNHNQEFAQLYDMDVSAPMREASPESISGMSVSIFPNPASDKITVRSSEVIASVQLSDLTGRVVKSVSCDKSEVELNVSDLKKGLYVCNAISQSGEISISKLFIE